MGGLNINKTLIGNCEKYDINDDTWITISSLNNKRYQFSSIVYKDR